MRILLILLFILVSNTVYADHHKICEGFCEGEELEYDGGEGKMPNDVVIKGKKKIIIVPDGPLYGLPFELLFDKENQKWLLEKYAVTISPSVYSFFGLNKNVEFNTANSFVGFGNPKIRDTKLADNSKLKNTIELVKKMERLLAGA